MIFIGISRNYYLEGHHIFGEKWLQTKNMIHVRNSLNNYDNVIDQRITPICKHISIGLVCLFKCYV